MKKKNISPFKPRKIIDVKTAGFNVYTFNCEHPKFLGTRTLEGKINKVQ